MSHEKAVEMLNRSNPADKNDLGMEESKKIDKERKNPSRKQANRIYMIIPRAPVTDVKDEEEKCDSSEDSIFNDSFESLEQSPQQSERASKDEESKDSFALRIKSALQNEGSVAEWKMSR